MRKISFYIPLAVLLLAAAGPASAAKVEQLPRELREWLDDVEPLITKQERKAFLALDKDYQRKAFIRRFWEARDPTPGTRENEFQQRYYARLEEARKRYGNFRDDRTRVFALHGEPAEVYKTDCGAYTWPMEFWTYPYSDVLERRVQLLFYGPSGAPPYKLWHPSEGFKVIFYLLNPATYDNARKFMMGPCAEMFDTAVELWSRIDEIWKEQGATQTAAAEPPDSEDPEWLATFQAFSTDAAEDAKPLSASVDFHFTGRHQSRTVVEGTLEVPLGEAGEVVLAGRHSYNFELTGEVLIGDELFESFRYRFDVPAERLRSDVVPLTFERYLRPGSYALVLRLEDLGQGGVFRQKIDLEVPTIDAAPAAVPELDAAAPAVAAAMEDPGEATVRLLSSANELQTGQMRFEAEAEGRAIDKVTFLLDDHPVLTKTKPPYSVELNLGKLPHMHSVRVVALASDGRELATDEVLVNPGEHNFVARLVEPRKSVGDATHVRARAEIEVPEGKQLDRVELYLNEERVATLYQPPWVQSIDLDGTPPGLTYLRLVAFLDDGNSTEDVVVVRGPGFGESVDVRLVELYASVVDARGQPVLDLTADDFRVLENSASQEIVRFESLHDLPLHAGLLIDTSASMADNLPAVKQIATQFFEQALTPRDRAAIVTFSERPRLAARFTDDLDTLSGALAGLRAEQGTALWDSLVFALYYFHGLSGQRALIVLSDGEDRRSRYTFDEALRYAGSTGVTIYAIGLEGGAKGNARDRMARLAEETGGRAFFLQSVAELGGVYESIQQDLRSRYLLVYQPPSTDDESFRKIEVRAGSGLQVRTLRGYYP